MTQLQTLPMLNDGTHPSNAPDEAGFGALQTTQGCLPLAAMDVQAKICGLAAHVRVEQTFINTSATPIEATYIFPLPDRAAVTQFQLRVGDKLIEGILKERAEARQEYDRAIQQGHRAAIAEENRPDVFSLRVGNLMPGDRAIVTLALAGPLEYADGEATFRFPLVVAPRYIPGTPLSGEQAGQGSAPDTNLVPDASCISPPVLLPGFPNPVRLSLSAEIDPAGLSVGVISSSLHAVETNEGVSGRRTVRIQPAERLNRDFILRLAIAESSVKSSLVLNPDAQGNEGTFQLTLVPPAAAARAQKPRDVVLVLDRSGSMSGWKMVAARRAAARIVDTLTPADRLAVFGFDSVVETPDPNAGDVLVPATDRNRYRAVEFLARLDARGGTEMATPLARGTKLLAAADPSRDRILVLVTDGQVGGEDHLLATIGSQAREIRIFTLGIDQAVNAGFLRRLAAIGGGACDLVESEDRLDEVMDKIHRRISTPLLMGVGLEAEGLKLDRETLVPARMPDLHAGVPLVVMGRYSRAALSSGQPQATVKASDVLGEPWSQKLVAKPSDNRAVTTIWARGRVRDLEDKYAIRPGAELERQIVATSLKFGVLCRFTAFVAVDRSEKVNEKGQVHKIIQPVEYPAGWEEESLELAEASYSLSAPAGAATLLQSIFGAAFGPVRSLGVPQGSRLMRRSMAPPAAMASPPASPPPAPPAAMSVDSCLQDFEAPCDLSAYRARVAGWLDELGRLPTGDRAARVQYLRELARKLAELVADLSSIGAPADEVEPLEELAAALSLAISLSKLGPSADTAEVERLEKQATQVLSAFAQVRPAFWKQAPTP